MFREFGATCRIFVGALGGLLLLATGVFAGEVQARGWPGRGLSKSQVCLYAFTARRQGRESCWVEMKAKIETLHASGLSETVNAPICLDQVHWTHWLTKPQRCFHALGEWKSNSFPADVGDEKTLKLRWMLRSVSWDAIRETSTPLSHKLWAWIERRRENLNTLFEPHDPFGIARRLLVNQREPGESGPLIQRLGFVHLLTITGIHLYAWASSLSTVLAWVLPRLGVSLMAGIHLRRCLVFVTWLYAWLLCGCRPGMLRPWGVILLRGAAERVGWRWSIGAPLFFSLLIDLGIAGVKLVLLREPEPWSPGRVIYALAVGGGIWAVSSAGRGATHLGLSIGSWIFVAHFEALAEGWVAPLTPLINALTLPLYCWFLFPLGMLASLIDSLSGLFGSLSWISIGVGWACACVGTATSGLLSAALALPSLWILKPWTLFAGLAIALIRSAFRIPAPAFVLLLLGMRLGLEGVSWVHSASRIEAAGADAQSVASYEVEQWDVGQGDATFVRAWDGSSLGLIDVGSERALGEVAWIERLARRDEIARVDWITLTHLDEDHAGGLLKLAQVAEIGCVVAPLAELRSERGREFLRELGHAGTRRPRVFGVVRGPDARGWEVTPRLPLAAMGCLPPGIAWKLLEGRGARNAHMLALAVPTRSGWYLNAGDADESMERELLPWLSRRTRWFQKAERILKVSHHGSRYSSGSGFLSALRPSEAWISSGVGNPHGHPAAQTLQRIEQASTPAIIVRRTDREGTITLR
jgi:beta-lactamase superfamily II metal-dependent hydrolase